METTVTPDMNKNNIHSIIKICPKCGSKLNYVFSPETQSVIPKCTKCNNYNGFEIKLEEFRLPAN